MLLTQKLIVTVTVVC